MGSSIKSVTSGKSLIPGAFDKGKELLLGKKDEGIADKTIGLDASLAKVTEQGRGLQGQALTQYGDMLKSSVGGQMAAMERQARAGVEDQTRQAQKMVAQRGLGGSSLGLNTILNQSKGLSDQLGAIRGSEQQLKQQNLQNATGGINSILGAQGAQTAFVQGTPGGGRKGGLAPLLGMAAGAAIGGPAGAQIGQGVGQAMTQM